jgi:hypothetical protein
MNTFKFNPPAWGKYVNRLILVMILMVFLGCDDTGCGNPNSACGQSVKITRGSGIPERLTEQSPTLRIVTDDACPYMSEATYSLYYQYHDIPSLNRGTMQYPARQATEQDKPSVSVKFGTLERGVQNNPGPSKPAFGSGEWEVHGSGGPGGKMEGAALAPVHYVLTITMQKPWIRLPGKAPTIALPFIGPIIGPQPRDVDLRVELNYRAYKPAPNSAK